jgi:hypothetical protein
LFFLDFADRFFDKKAHEPVCALAVPGPDLTGLTDRQEFHGQDRYR